MPRHKQFTEDEVIDQAVELFWLKGYQLGLTELESRLGVGRKSLYNAFGNKENLFLLALKRYSKKMSQQIRDKTSELNDPVEQFRIFFQMVKANVLHPDCKGCFATNTILEANHNEQVEELTTAFVQDRHEIFSTLLDQGIANGYLKKTTPVDKLVHNLSNQVSGLGLKAKFSSTSEKEVDNIVQFCLESIEQYRQ